MSDAPHAPEWSGWIALLSLVSGAIGAGLMAAFRTGRKVQADAQNTADIAAIRATIEKFDRKLDSLLSAVNLVARASDRHEAEIESLRRDITRLQENAA